MAHIYLPLGLLNYTFKINKHMKEQIFLQDFHTFLVFCWSSHFSPPFLYPSSPCTMNSPLLNTFYSLLPLQKACIPPLSCHFLASTCTHPHVNTHKLRGRDLHIRENTWHPCFRKAYIPSSHISSFPWHLFSRCLCSSTSIFKKHPSAFSWSSVLIVNILVSSCLISLCSSPIS